MQGKTIITGRNFLESTAYKNKWNAMNKIAPCCRLCPTTGGGLYAGFLTGNTFMGLLFLSLPIVGAGAVFT